jgi:hypothetical protein
VKREEESNWKRRKENGNRYLSSNSYVLFSLGRGIKETTRS